MIKRSTVLFVAGMMVATALTFVGTYYAVEWLSPPLNMYGNARGGTGEMAQPR